MGLQYLVYIYYCHIFLINCPFIIMERLRFFFLPALTLKKKNYFMRCFSRVHQVLGYCLLIQSINLDLLVGEPYLFAPSCSWEWSTVSCGVVCCLGCLGFGNSFCLSCYCRQFSGFLCWTWWICSQFFCVSLFLLWNYFSHL